MVAHSCEGPSHLLATIGIKLEGRNVFGSMSTNIYDTAWVFMVAKPQVDGKTAWLFPQSFHLLLSAQSVEGGLACSSEMDSVLSTMAALLSMLKHDANREIVGCMDLPPDHTLRISRAVVWLDTILRTFDIRRCADNVAFEILLTCHLRYLESYGVKFQIPNFMDISRLGEAKLRKLDLGAIYAGKASTVAHSLEALIGIIDFDKIRPQLMSNGSMMASPSSTAAFLMSASEWNFQAEEYLISVFENGEGRGNGAFPCAYPTEIFETSWVVVLIAFSSTVLRRYRLSQLYWKLIYGMSCPKSKWRESAITWKRCWWIQDGWWASVRTIRPILGLTDLSSCWSFSRCGRNSQGHPVLKSIAKTYESGAIDKGI